MADNRAVIADARSCITSSGVAAGRASSTSLQMSIGRSGGESIEVATGGDLATIVAEPSDAATLELLDRGTSLLSIDFAARDKMLQETVYDKDIEPHH